MSKTYKKINIGNTAIGGDAKIAIQSMCNIPFSRFEELLSQSLRLEEAGCDILRVSVPDFDSATLFEKLKNALKIPLVADIHFDYRLAVASIESGADKIRINPGNIGEEHIGKVTAAATAAKIPIRIGVNGGSLEKQILEKYGSPTAEALAESALKNVEILEKNGFFEIVVSIKSSDVRKTVEAYRIFDKNNKNKYPLHIGVTEAGTINAGLIKNSVGIGSLLLDGIGSTIRYSLSAPPEEEIYAAKTLLRSLDLFDEGVEIIACPTCGRTTIDVSFLAETLEKKLSKVKKHLKIAVMGCVVNGPGEAAESDIGVTGANGKYVVFQKDENTKKSVVALKNADLNEALNYILSFCGVDLS